MIKVTLTGSIPQVMWINPVHVTWINEKADHTCNIRTRGSDTYNVRESMPDIQEQILALLPRMYQ